jgi:hypothetical protein
VQSGDPACLRGYSVLIHMSNSNLDLLINEIGHEISRDAKGWYFTQAAASRVCGMDHKTIRQGLQLDAPVPWASGLGPSKLLKSIAAQGISPAGLDEFKVQWRQGRVTDLMVSCLITYAATQKKGERDSEVVALHGLMAAAGLRKLLDASFGVEDVNGRVTARLNGINTRVSYATAQAQRHKNIGAYTAAVTGAITGHSPKAWNDQLLPAQFGDKAGRIRDHADEATINLIEAAERGMSGSNVTVTEAAAFAAGIRRMAEQHLGYKGPELSPAKLTPRVTRDVSAGKKSSLADASTGALLPSTQADD